MSDDPNPDYRDLLRSPYDPDPDDGAGRSGEGDSELPWVPAVVAAALGAFLVGAFVVYAVVAGPVEDEVLVDESTTTTQAVPVQATEVPDGFVAITDEIGARVVSVDTSAHAITVAVSTAVAGTLDPAEVEPLHVAYWVLDDGDTADANPMVRQYEIIGSLGNVTVDFPPQASLREPEIIPYLASGETTSHTLTLELDASVPQVLGGMMIDFGNGRVVVIDELTIADGWGWVAWSTLGDAVAMVDVIVTFEGTDDPGSDMIDPTRLASAHLQTPGFFGAQVPPPLYGFTGSASLVRAGEPLSSVNSPTAITVDITATVPDSVVQGSPIPLPSGG
ncbi:MAG TPA: hypothetical protein VLA29_12530 [Acidimicrobiia bacterium]|nr:hypothetical protein [Acidimicrobiia bacterium]